MCADMTRELRCGLLARRLVAGMVGLALATTLAGCSNGGSDSAPVGERTPSVLLPGDASSTTIPSPTTESPATKNFAAAVEFVRLVHIGDYGSAGGLVADNSPAARYIAYQTADRRAYELNGQPLPETDPNDVTIDGDEKTGAIKISVTNDGKTTSTPGRISISIHPASCAHGLVSLARSTKHFGRAVAATRRRA